MKIKKSDVIGLGPNHKLIKKYKSSLISLSYDQMSAAVGLMLGDASLQTQNKGKTFRLKFEWSNKNKAYLDSVYKLFDEWVLSVPHKKTRISPKGNLIVNWGFQTISHKAFNTLYDLFYSNELSSKKGISDNLIKYHLNEIGLTYWFMDDGGRLDYNKNSKNKSIVLNTHSFTENEVNLMANQLALKFKLTCSVRTNKGKKIIVIDNNSYDTFITLIDPYLISEMRYKLP